MGILLYPRATLDDPERGGLVFTPTAPERFRDEFAAVVEAITVLDGVLVIDGQAFIDEDRVSPGLARRHAQLVQAGYVNGWLQISRPLGQP